MLGLIVVIAVVIPACVLFEKSLLGGWLDAALWAYWAGGDGVHGGPLAAEHAAAGSTTRLQAVVIACVLTGRALARAVRRRHVVAPSCFPPRWPRWPYRSSP